MATLKTRLEALEAAKPMTERTDHEANGFYFPQVMAEAEWCEAAAKQQAELCREVINENA